LGRRTSLNINMEEQLVETKKSDKGRWLIFFISLFALIVLAITFGFSYIYYQIYSPADKGNGEQSLFSVAKGESVKAIAAKLRSENFIRSQFWFEAYVWYEKQQANLQAGDYALSPNLSIPEILQIITGGKVISNEIQVTFPEGFDASQIKDRLLENGIKSASALDQEKIDGFQLQYKFLGEVSPDLSLEGFLFPDTYRFNKDIKKEEIIKKFLDNFDKKLTPAWRAEIERQHRTIYEVVTLASIVQQEALNEQEMPTIAGIFLNRLKIGMALESDATVNYITGKKDRQVTSDDTKIISPYNSYLNKGLPPTPISNPGIEAIKAAIYPQQSDYLYFLHPLNSPAVYSKTLDEHNWNKAKYLK